MITIARFASASGAIVWLVGLPFAGMAGVVQSDGSYFWIGIVAAMLGLISVPLVVAYPHPPLRALSRSVRAVGATACAALLLAGALLIAGSTGYLGERAPTWVLPAVAVALAVYFFWVLIATNSDRKSQVLGRSVFWLGVAAGSSGLMFLLVPVLMYSTENVVFNTLLSLLVWLCLPSWLIAIGVRMRSQSSAIEQLGE